MKQSGSMVSAGGGEPPAGSAWLKAAALALVVAALGLPLDHLLGYAVALVAAVIIFSGEVSPLPARWAVALAIVVLSALAQSWVSPPRIDEGGNVFLPESQGALRAGLPSDVYDTLLRQFDAQYPPLSRCATSKCWEADERPDRLYAFSADGVLTRAPLSRSVTSIDFSDPIWLRLGFTNEFRYNWSGGNANGLERNHRDGRFWMGLHRWHLLMPWFVSYQFPAAYVGSTLCWNGTVLWEGDNQRFATFSGDAETCRNIASVDIGRRVVGIAIKPDTLAMRLERSWGLRLRSAVQGALALFGVLVVVAGLVRWRAQRLILPLSLIGLALVVIAIDDASFIGGVRPFDGGDDGLFYDGVGRAILQHVLACDFAAALEGGEKVYFYGGPGLRYFRALEHL